MPFVPLSKQRHATKSWRRFDSYSFAAKQHAVSIVGGELVQAAHEMPLGFLQQGDAYALVGLLSPVPGRNLFVAPDGRWVGDYVPAAFRGYPFQLIPQGASRELALCVDEEPSVVVDGAAGHERFFDDAGQLTAATKGVFDFLSELVRSGAIIKAAVSALAACEVLQPWPIKYRVEDKEHTVSGLHCINETTLNALPEDAFIRLRKTSALPIAYAQLLSMGRLKKFEILSKIQEQLLAAAARLEGNATKPALPDNLDKIFMMSSDDTIRFD